MAVSIEDIRNAVVQAGIAAKNASRIMASASPSQVYCGTSAGKRERIAFSQ